MGGWERKIQAEARTQTEGTPDWARARTTGHCIQTLATQKRITSKGRGPQASSARQGRMLDVEASPSSDPDGTRGLSHGLLRRTGERGDASTRFRVDQACSGCLRRFRLFTGPHTYLDGTASLIYLRLWAVGASHSTATLSPGGSCGLYGLRLMHRLNIFQSCFGPRAGQALFFASKWL